MGAMRRASQPPSKSVGGSRMLRPPRSWRVPSREILQVQALPEGRMEVARVPLIAESQVQGDEVRPEGRYFPVSYVTLTLRVSCRVHSSTDCVRGKFFCIVGPLYREAALVTVICHILLQRLLRLRDVPCLRTLR